MIVLASSEATTWPDAFIIVAIVIVAGLLIWKWLDS